MRTKRLLTSFITLGMLVLATSWLARTAQAAPVTFTVTNANDAGAGSLRQAILDANANGNPSNVDVIEFAIAGDGTHRITLDSSIGITQAVKIDGYTQGDAHLNTATFPEPMNGSIRIEAYFDGAGSIGVTSSNVTITGIAFGENWQSPNDGIISVDGADNFKLIGSFVGTYFTGFTYERFLQENGSVAAVKVVDSASVQIGGGSPGDRNVFGVCNTSCIEASGASTNLKIQGNNIGLGADGITNLFSTTAAPNMPAVYIHDGADDAQVGGQTAGQGNFIIDQDGGALLAEDISGLTMYGNSVFYNNQVTVDSISYASIALLGVTSSTFGSEGAGKNLIGASLSNGMYIGDSPVTDAVSSDITVIGNKFGYNYTGEETLSDIGHEINIAENTHSVLIRSNVLHNSTSGSGVSVNDSAANIAILQNSIYNNSDLGIKLGPGSITNDADDIDTGPNDLLNSPGYTNITEDGGNTSVTFTADIPAGNYRIEFFTNDQVDPDFPGEGQSYLGFANIVSAGSGLQEFEHVLSGTGHQNLALTATEITNTTPSGFGATSQFGAQGELIPPDYDLAFTKRLLNPQDNALGQQLQYEITVANNGPDSYDLTQLNSSIPGDPADLLVDILPPQLEYNSVAGDVACTDLGPGSASFFGPVLGNHSEYSLVGCGYTGSQTLDAGESVSFVITTTVVDDSNANFTNYVLGSTPVYDRDITAFSNIFNELGADDLIDLAMASTLNNFDDSPSTQADVSITKTLDNPEAALVDGELQYTITYTNNGPESIDPTDFDGAGGNPFPPQLFYDILPANLTYVSQSNSDLDCVWYGAGSASLTPFLANHQDYSLLFCSYIGSTTELAAGQSISTVVRATSSNPGSSFTNYAIANGPLIDPDNRTMSNIFEQDDMLDTLLLGNLNNVASVTTTMPNDPEEEVDQPGGGSGSNGSIVRSIVGSVTSALGLDEPTITVVSKSGGDVVAATSTPVDVDKQLAAEQNWFESTSWQMMLTWLLLLLLFMWFIWLIAKKRRKKDD